MAICVWNLVLEEEPYHQFKLQVKSEGFDEDAEIGYSCSLKFTYTPEYPEEVPVLEIIDSVGMDDLQIEKLKELLEKDAEENLGMVMVFTLISTANGESLKTNIWRKSPKF